LVSAGEEPALNHSRPPAVVARADGFLAEELVLRPGGCIGLVQPVATFANTAKAYLLPNRLVFCGLSAAENGAGGASWPAREALIRQR